MFNQTGIFFLFWPCSTILSSVFADFRSVPRVFSRFGYVSGLCFLKKNFFLMVHVISQLHAMKKLEVSRPISITLNGLNYTYIVLKPSPTFSKPVESGELSMERLLLLFKW